MSDQYLLPRDIVSCWSDALSRITLTDNVYHFIMSVIRHSLPPVCAPALQRAIEIHAADHAPLSLHQILDAHLQNELSQALPRRLATRFPLFVAMSDPRYLGSIDNPLARLGRQLLHDWFAEAPDRAKPSLYYSHIIQVRTMVQLVAQSDEPPPAPGTDTCNTLISLLGSDKLSYQIARHQKAYELFIDLAEGRREPGVPVRHITHRRGGRRGGPRRDTWQDARLAELAQSTPPPRQRVDPARVADLADDEVPEEACQLGIRQHAIPSASSDDDTEIVYQRRTPSTLTPRDDMQLVRRLLRASATSSLATVEDLHRLPRERVRAVLEADLPDDLHVIVLLLLATGMPLARLTRLRLAEETLWQQGSTLPEDEDPRWDPISATLSYLLTDGPRDHAATANRWITLALPSTMSAPLTEALDQADSTLHESCPAEDRDGWPRPFRRVATRLNRRLSRRFANAPGLTPTASRLRASSWLWRRPHARDDVAAQVLTGSLGLGLSAPAAYRRIERDEIQAVFDKTLQTLGVEFVPEQPLPFPLRAAGLRTLGSPVALAPCAFRPVFEALRQVLSPTLHEWQVWSPGTPLPRQALVRVAELIACHSYLGWLLATGARPLGDGSRNRVSQTSMWIRDKSSSQGDESRVIPLDPQIADALHRYAAWIARTVTWWQDRGGRLEDRHEEHRDTPAWLSPGRRSDTLMLREMTHQDLKHVLKHLPGLPTEAYHWPDNVTRHSLASWLRHDRPDGEVDALLGHAHHGQGLTAPRATATIGPQRALRHALRDWLVQTGYSPLPWGVLRC